MFKILVLSILFEFGRISHSLNNVCSVFGDYNTMQRSENCWHNPDVGSSPSAIVVRYGYKFELHQTVTDDGYKLGIFRILPKNRRFNEPRVVFLQHGILETAMSWLSLGEQSLAFKLSDSGFDVWLGNFRGTIYSNEHIKLSDVSDEKYWDFSFHELAYYDLDAMFKRAAEITQTKNKIIYIGHSLGSATSYIYSITRRKEARDKLAALISFAPIAFMKHTHINFSLLSTFSGVIYNGAKLLKIYALGISKQGGQTLFYKLCLYGSTQQLCRYLANIFLKLIASPAAPEMLPVILTQAPAATSLTVLRQFSQEILHTGKFQAFDYGFSNFQRYGTVKPPIYNVSEIDLPVYLMYGKKDRVADEEDVKALYKNLKTNKFLIPVAEDGRVKYNHVDFLFSKEIEFLYKPLFKIIEYLSNDMQ